MGTPRAPVVSTGVEVQLMNVFGCFSGVEMARSRCTALLFQFLDTLEAQCKTPFGVSNYSYAQQRVRRGRTDEALPEQAGL